MLMHEDPCHEAASFSMCIMLERCSPICIEDGLSTERLEDMSSKLAESFSSCRQCRNVRL